MSTTPQVLWSMQYHQTDDTPPVGQDNDHTVPLPTISSDLALSDALLDDVKEAWSKITGDGDEAFLKFDAREGMEDED